MYQSVNKSSGRQKRSTPAADAELINVMAVQESSDPKKTSEGKEYQSRGSYRGASRGGHSGSRGGYSNNRNYSGSRGGYSSNRGGYSGNRSNPTEQILEQLQAQMSRLATELGQKNGPQGTRSKPTFTKGIFCAKCSQEGHTPEECWERECYNCHNFGHIRRDCPEKQARRSSVQTVDLNGQGLSAKAESQPDKS
jgi:hypothetical protein